MKIHIPNPRVEDLVKNSTGDSYGYYGIATSLTKIIQEANQHLVVGVNNKWGEGKTTFLKLWEYELNRDNAPVIYIDAFQYEVLEDPFFPLCAEITKILPEDKKGKIIERAKEVAVGTIKFAGASLIKVLTSGVSDGGLLEKSGVEGDLASKGAQLVEDGIQKASVYLENNKEFKELLKVNINETFEGVPLIVMIDELDRCRPNFSLSFLERIKHLFDIENIVFIIAVNRNQLYSSIKHEYGSDLNPHEYSQKFFSFWASLPRKARTATNDLDKPREYLSYCLDVLEYDNTTIAQEEIVDLFDELTSAFNLTLREIQRALTSYAFVNNSYPHWCREFYELAAVLSVLNVKHTDIHKHFVHEHAFIKFYEESELLKLAKDGRLYKNMNRFAFLLWFYTLEVGKAREEFKNYSAFVADKIGDDWISKIIYTIELNSDLS